MRRTTALLATFALLLGACSSPASRDGMTPQEMSLSRQHPHSVQVMTQGGTETGALDTTNISDADLKGAIEDSIARNKLFRTVIQGKGADYELTVRVAGLSKPVIGASLQVELETGWTLVRTSDRAVLLRKPIKSSATKTMGDAFAFVTRLRMAIEAATQDNIAQGLKAIAELKLE